MKRREAVKLARLVFWRHRGDAGGDNSPEIGEKMRKNKAVELLIVALLGVLIISIAVNPARAQVAASGFAVTDFATGFLSGNSGGCFPCGPLGLASDSSDNLFVMDPLTGFIYK